MAEDERVGLDSDELPLAKHTVQYVADKGLMRRLERLERVARRMVNQAQLPTWAGTLPFHLDPTDWRTGFLEVYESGPPAGLSSMMKENAPQALLRDLYRPEYEVGWLEPEILVEFDRAGVKALKEARAAQKRDPIPHVKPLGQEVMQHARAWRKFVGDRWKPHLDDSQPRREVEVLHDPSLNW